MFVWLWARTYFATRSARVGFSPHLNDDRGWVFAQLDDERFCTSPMGRWQGVGCVPYMRDYTLVGPVGREVSWSIAEPISLESRLMFTEYPLS